MFRCLMKGHGSWKSGSLLRGETREPTISMCDAYDEAGRGRSGLELPALRYEIIMFCTEFKRGIGGV